MIQKCPVPNTNRFPKVNPQKGILVEFMYLVFTRMSGESYRRQFVSVVVFMRRLSIAN